MDPELADAFAEIILRVYHNPDAAIDNQAPKPERDNTPELLRDGAATIQRLRRQNEILAAKVSVMDMFATLLYTQPAGGCMGAEPDVAWAMEKRAQEITNRPQPRKPPAVAKTEMLLVDELVRTHGLSEAEANKAVAQHGMIVGNCLQNGEQSVPACAAEILRKAREAAAND